MCDEGEPLREPGRLTLIAQMGADTVAERLPSLVQAVRFAGHRVIWLCDDPTHANTITAPYGMKSCWRKPGPEVRRFREVVAAAGGPHPGRPGPPGPPGRRGRVCRRHVGTRIRRRPVHHAAQSRLNSKQALSPTRACSEGHRAFAAAFPPHRSEEVDQ
ncbi:3-deoxy-7-phosphoheptulonate synthase [Streptomyces sp. NPDC052236]|uniref:3-deoxy-7-phosphoheptulonate synthase n=1 Tax=Streptomyces sp. NPDC052236 TaxID=3365686 RepID=UPI0037D7BC95